MESYEKIKKVLALGFMNFLDENKPKDKMCLSNGECEDIEKAFNEQDWPRLAGYLDKYTESEDEKTRTLLVALVQWAKTFSQSGLLPNVANKMLSYLEKQKEQKEQPISAEEVLARAGLKPYKDGNQWCILAGDNIQEGICGFGDTIDEALYQFLMEVLEKQKEQKPAEWSDADMKEARNNLISVCRDWERGEQTTLLPIVAVRARYFLEHLTEPKPVEWSEEDEAMLDSVIRIITQIDDLAHEPTFAGPKWTHPYTKELAWLKSLRPRPSWKPSEEQMDALMDAINDSIMRYDYHGSPLKEEVTRKYSENLQSLYTQLKKL